MPVARRPNSSTHDRIRHQRSNAPKIEEVSESAGLTDATLLCAYKL